MSKTQTAIRVPASTLALADEVTALAPFVSGIPATRAAALRAALRRGLEAMRAAQEPAPFVPYDHPREGAEYVFPLVVEIRP